MRKFIGREISISITRKTPNLRDRIGLLPIDDILHGEFMRFVVGGQWAVHQTGRHEQPRFAGRFHEKGRHPIMVIQTHTTWVCRRCRSLRYREIRDVETKPLLFLFTEMDVAVVRFATIGRELPRKPCFFDPRLPSGLAAARLYRMRRFAGQANPQPSETQSSQFRLAA